MPETFCFWCRNIEQSTANRCHCTKACGVDFCPMRLTEETDALYYYNDHIPVPTFLER